MMRVMSTNPKMSEHVKFSLDDRDFARSYYRDEINAKGLDADYKLKLQDDYSKRNPVYYDYGK